MAPKRKSLSSDPKDEALVQRVFDDWGKEDVLPYSVAIDAFRDWLKTSDCPDVAPDALLHPDPLFQAALAQCPDGAFTLAQFSSFLHDQLAYQVWYEKAVRLFTRLDVGAKGYATVEDLVYLGVSPDPAPPDDDTHTEQKGSLSGLDMDEARSMIQLANRAARLSDAQDRMTFAAFFALYSEFLRPVSRDTALLYGKAVTKNK